MDQHREVLFWVFISFFTAIGTVSLLAVVGVLRTDARFQRWAVSGFIVGVAAAVFGLFKIVFTEDVPLIITLSPPREAWTSELNLVSGRYKYDEATSSGGVKTYSGKVELTLGVGGWQAKLPQRVLNRPVELLLQDRNEQWWGVRPFYPAHNRQELIKTSAPARSGALLPGRMTPDYQFTAATGSAFAEERPSSPASVEGEHRKLLKFDNYARPVESKSGRQFYKWRVFIDEPRDVLATIEKVQYVLHPTFPDPIVIVENSHGKFALEGSGWGGFTILITIWYRDGREQKGSYFLDLSKRWATTTSSLRDRRGSRCQWHERAADCVVGRERYASANE